MNIKNIFLALSLVFFFCAWGMDDKETQYKCFSENGQKLLEYYKLNDKSQDILEYLKNNNVDLTNAVAVKVINCKTSFYFVFNKEDDCINIFRIELDAIGSIPINGDLEIEVTAYGKGNGSDIHNTQVVKSEIIEKNNNISKTNLNTGINGLEENSSITQKLLEIPSFKVIINPIKYDRYSQSFKSQKNSFFYDYQFINARKIHISTVSKKLKAASKYLEGKVVESYMPGSDKYDWNGTAFSAVVNFYLNLGGSTGPVEGMGHFDLKALEKNKKNLKEREQAKIDQNIFYRHKKYRYKSKFTYNNDFRKELLDQDLKRIHYNLIYL